MGLTEIPESQARELAPLRDQPERWSITRQAANRQIATVELGEALGTTVPTGQARELALFFAVHEPSRLGDHVERGRASVDAGQPSEVAHN